MSTTTPIAVPEVSKTKAFFNALAWLGPVIIMTFLMAAAGLWFFSMVDDLVLSSSNIEQIDSEDARCFIYKKSISCYPK